MLADLIDRGLILERRNPITGTIDLVLSDPGRAEGERLVAAELDAAGHRPALRGLYEMFRPLNTRLLRVCADWQVVGDGDERRLNDHCDAAHDRAVLDRLAAVDSDVQPLLDKVTALLDRFETYGPRLRAARARVEAGELQWLDGAQIDSYHTVWFHLHEDLLVTLGLDRARETESGISLP
ncbi:MAG: transcriptional regulator [Actinomycetota bacterium]